MNRLNQLRNANGEVMFADLNKERFDKKIAAECTAIARAEGQQLQEYTHNTMPGKFYISTIPW